MKAEQRVDDLRRRWQHMCAVKASKLSYVAFFNAVPLAHSLIRAFRGFVPEWELPPWAKCELSVSGFADEQTGGGCRRQDKKREKCVSEAELVSRTQNIYIYSAIRRAYAAVAGLPVQRRRYKCPTRRAQSPALRQTGSDVITMA